MYPRVSDTIISELFDISSKESDVNKKTILNLNATSISFHDSTYHALHYNYTLVNKCRFLWHMLRSRGNILIIRIEEYEMPPLRHHHHNYYICKSVADDFIFS